MDRDGCFASIGLAANSVSTDDIDKDPATETASKIEDHLFTQVVVLPSTYDREPINNKRPPTSCRWYFNFGLGRLKVILHPHEVGGLCKANYAEG